MPNWCHNTITIKCKPNTAATVRKAITNSQGEFSFDVIIPYPEVYRQADSRAEAWRNLPADKRKDTTPPEDGYNHGGYEWCIVNWGTKWDADNVSLNSDDNAIYIECDTAWSPPLPVMAAISELPDVECVTIRYVEPGMVYAGEWTFRNGQAVRQMETSEVEEVDKLCREILDYSFLEGEELES